jgi:TatD DNase family protein
MTDAPTWIDSHAHLTMFDADELDEVLERAEVRGVRGVLVPATNGADLDTAVGLAADRPDAIVAAAGVHPHDASSLDGGLKRRVERALASPGVVAVGEIGLDYHYMNSPREDQRRALEWQLSLALEADLPVVLHNRESWDDLESALDARSPGLRGVTHSFTESAECALRVVELGLVVGISGMVTFKTADNIREMAGALTPEQVMVETDSPFLAPVPHRGSRNEPSFVVEVGRRLAEVWGLDGHRVASASSAVFRELFALPGAWPGGSC